MKKLTFLFLIALLISCEKPETTKPTPPPTTKCATCTEQATQVQSTYCGTVGSYPQNGILNTKIL